MTIKKNMILGVFLGLCFLAASILFEGTYLSGAPLIFPTFAAGALFGKGYGILEQKGLT
jgi:hypothetical protein